MHKSIRNIILLAAITPIAFILIWTITIKKTFDLNKENKQIIENLEKLNNAPNQVSILNQELEKLDRLIGSSSQDIGGDQIFGTLSESISKYPSLRIIDFPFQSIFDNKNYIINTYVVTIQGNYFDLLKILNTTERDKQLGKIVAVEYKVEKDLRSKKKKLYMLLYVQTYTKKNL